MDIIQNTRNYFVHPSSFVDEPCEVGEGTKIWHFCHISSGAQIGERCSIGQNCFVALNVKIGNNVKVQNNVSIYEGVELEDDVFCGPSMVFTNVVNPRSSIVRKNEYKKTRIGQGATIGANATILCGHDIGSYAFISAGAVITSDVPAYALMIGVPARQKGWMSAGGHRLDFDERGRAVCPTTKEEYEFVDSQLRRLT